MILIQFSSNRILLKGLINAKRYTPDGQPKNRQSITVIKYLAISVNKPFPMSLFILINFVFLLSGTDDLSSA